MSLTNSSCFNVTIGGAENWTIDWALNLASTLEPLASGTTSNGTWTACVNEPFGCAELTARVSPHYEVDDVAFLTTYSAGSHVVWNGTVWAQGVVKPDPYNEVSIAWIGNECHNEIYQICHKLNPNTWLLDVELTTTEGDDPELSVYWVVYSDFLGSRSNLLHDPYVHYHQPNTTYRSYSCIEYNGGCNELGLYQRTPLPSDPIIRVNGIVKTDSWNCTQGFCDGNTVTPLQGCSESLSGGAIAGIVIAAVVGATILYWAAARFIRRKQNSLEQEQAQD